MGTAPESKETWIQWSTFWCQYMQYIVNLFIATINSFIKEDSLALENCVFTM